MMSRRVAPFFLVVSSVVVALPASAQSLVEDALYAEVRGWRVVQNEAGCSAFPPGMAVIFNTPPAGGWQLVLPDPAAGPEGNVAGVVEIGKLSFEDIFYGDGAFYYGSFPLAEREAAGAAQEMRVDIGALRWQADLAGSTAALLKVEDCWTRLTGWSAETSSRAGTFAFSGD